jgi:ferredoxin-NADP reductase
MPQHFPLRLHSFRDLAPGVRHLVFRRPEPMPYIAGQFLQVHFEHEGTATKRSYSLANIPKLSDEQDLEIAVSYVEGGAASKLLFGLSIGAELDGSGPYGRFCLLESDKNQRYVLVGTGTGITPYRAMFDHIRRVVQERGAKFVIVQGARTHQELLYRDDFRALQAELPEHVRYIGCVSREPANASVDTIAGHVQQGLDQIGMDPNQDVVYLCGNPNMVDQCFNSLKEQNFPVPAVRREKYISSK